MVSTRNSQIRWTPKMMTAIRVSDDYTDRRAEIMSLSRGKRQDDAEMVDSSDPDVEAQI